MCICLLLLWVQITCCVSRQPDQLGRFHVSSGCQLTSWSDHHFVFCVGWCGVKTSILYGSQFTHGGKLFIAAVLTVSFHIIHNHHLLHYDCNHGLRYYYWLGKVGGRIASFIDPQALFNTQTDHIQESLREIERGTSHVSWWGQVLNHTFTKNYTNSIHKPQQCLNIVTKPCTNIYLHTRTHSLFLFLCFSISLFTFSHSQIKLSDLGLTESIVEHLVKTYCNNSTDTTNATPTITTTSTSTPGAATSTSSSVSARCLLLLLWWLVLHLLYV